jgi:hypothetical protein
MTQAEWLACTEPQKMLDFLRGKVGERKLRLFACAWCRYSCPYLAAPTSTNPNRPTYSWAAAAADTQTDCRNALAVAERYTDGQTTDAERHAAHTRAADWVNTWLTYDLALYYDAIVAAAAAAPAHAGNTFLPPAAPYLAGPVGDAALAADRAQQAVFLREVVGNPFQPKTVDPSWLEYNGGVVRELAETIYQTRRFGELPRLAQLLEAAGCTDRDILHHCRRRPDRWLGTWGFRRALALLGQQRPPRFLHVRGCWVLDLILSKDR